MFALSSSNQDLFEKTFATSTGTKVAAIADPTVRYTTNARGVGGGSDCDQYDAHERDREPYRWAATYPFVLDRPR